MLMLNKFWEAKTSIYIKYCVGSKLNVDAPKYKYDILINKY